MSLVVGIDPGKKGAVAVLDSYGEIVDLYDMPVAGNQVSGTLLAALVDGGENTVAVVEQVHSMPEQGVASSFDFGKSYGIVLGVLSGAGIRTEHVSPIRWKRDLRVTSDKETCRLRAIERWPMHAELFKRKKDADRAEAALIALWWIESKDKPAEEEVPVLSVPAGIPMEVCLDCGRLTRDIGGHRCSN